MNTKEYPKDSAGEVILPGDLVAYNRSGDVILGRVVNYRLQGYRPPYGYFPREPKWEVSIVPVMEMAEKDWRSQPKSSISKVKNTRGIKVIG